MKTLFFIAFFASFSLQGVLHAQSNANGSASKAIEKTQPENIQRTLSILKPDTVRDDHIGEVIARLENQGLHVVAMKMVKLNKEQAEQFYKVHKDRPFFSGLVNFMTSGPIVVMVLEGDQAISKNREIMGATNPKEAKEGTIRKDYAASLSENAIHGSDSPETAREEIQFFFHPNDIQTTKRA